MHSVYNRDKCNTFYNKDPLLEGMLGEWCDKLNILTCNIRFYGAADGTNDWVHRREVCAEIIRSHGPDVICFQEMWSQQFTDLSSSLSDYQSFAVVDEPVGRHPMNCIFYRAEVYTLISAGGYWLSEHPHVPGSKSWQSCCVRLANWIRLEDNSTKKEFRVLNTHLDHISQTARENQARLIVQDSSAYPHDYPQILTGDMNCDFRNMAIDILKDGGWADTYRSVHGTEDPGHTYHEFLGPQYDSSIGKMDWVFIRGNIKVFDAKVITDSIHGRFPSDHYFVSAILDLGA